MSQKWLTDFKRVVLNLRRCDCRDVKILTKGEDINDFSPLLFEKRLEQDESIDNNQDLINAFKEIMESLQSSGQSINTPPINLHERKFAK
jgi:hypothetical protein